MKEEHTWTSWSYCEDFVGVKFSRVCEVCGTIEMTNHPCKI